MNTCYYSNVECSELELNTGYYSNVECSGVQWSGGEWSGVESWHGGYAGYATGAIYGGSKGTHGQKVILIRISVQGDGHLN